jgi:thymidine kinase
MEWRRRAGIVSEEEYLTYSRLFYLLEPLILKPDLLIMLKPNSLERLWEGLQARIQAEPEIRRMEKAVTEKDLETVCRAAEEAVEILNNSGLRVMAIEVDPLEVYRNPELRYSTVYAIREKLGILSELLTKNPKEVARQIMAILATKREPQVVIVHSQSMFAGKTSALSFVAEMVGPEKVVVFQPRAAIRWEEEGHLTNMIDRDRRKTPATTIEDNSLTSIIKILKEQGITPQTHPFVFIDEVMLFVGSDASEAIGVIEFLRQDGFCVIVDGIDYTFQELPFTFMHELLGQTKENPNWHQIEMGTRCKYCGKPAKGSRRLKPDGSIADFGDKAFQAGENYEPVCCIDHPSCLGQPSDFQRPELPI